MALEGSLKDFGLADILQLIFFQRKTGVLTLEGRLDKVRLLFIQGNIAGAESKRRMEANRLGKVLLKKGLLKEEDLQVVLDEQRSSNVKFGNILVKRGLVTQAEIEAVLSGQIKETVIQIFNWKEGSYEFTPQAIPVDRDIPISIDTQHLLMEGLRIVDEWALIEGKITLDSVFSKKTEEIKGLTDEEREIFSLVDGENDISTIVDISGKDDFSVSKTLLSLIEKDVIEPKEVLPVVTEAPLPGKKESAFSYRFLPLSAVLIAFLISLFVVSSTSDKMIARLKTSEAIDDLRFRTEAYKFEHGLYPERLDLISSKLDPWGRPYIYQHNNYTFIILSTGPDGEEGTSDDIY